MTQLLLAMRFSSTGRLGQLRLPRRFFLLTLALRSGDAFHLGPQCRFIDNFGRDRLHFGLLRRVQRIRTVQIEQQETAQRSMHHYGECRRQPILIPCLAFRAHHAVIRDCRPTHLRAATSTSPPWQHRHP